MSPGLRVRKFKPAKADRGASKKSLLVIESRKLTPAPIVAAMFRKVAV